MDTSVIVGGRRTPMGRLLGQLAGFSGTDLGGIAIKSALERSRLSPEQVDYVIMGQVLVAGEGQMPARQAAVKAGIPMHVPALTVNKVCLSGIQAIILADQLIRAGAADVVVAGGQESMTAAPRLLGGSRRGVKFGDMQLRDHMRYDGLHDAYTGEGMGLLTEAGNDRNPIPRVEQDKFAARSHRKAAAALRAGIFAEEIAPITTTISRGEVVLDQDEGIRSDATAESLAALRPAFRDNGTVTAGNSSPISDGAAAVVVMSRRKAEELGLEWLAEIGAHGMVAGPDSGLQLQPARAIQAACKREGISTGELDLVEINEAFAAVGLASVEALGLDPARVNVNGGAIALGHPLGMSGARLVLHLALELRRRGGGVGAAALCGGGGQGDALILRVPAAA